jgi:hypothetical protein
MQARLLPRIFEQLVPQQREHCPISHIGMDSCKKLQVYAGYYSLIGNPQFDISVKIACPASLIAGIR